jgi:hypothetical protein
LIVSIDIPGPPFYLKSMSSRGWLSKTPLWRPGQAVYLADEKNAARNCCQVPHGILPLGWGISQFYGRFGTQPAE